MTNRTPGNNKMANLSKRTQAPVSKLARTLAISQAFCLLAMTIPILPTQAEPARAPVTAPNFVLAADLSTRHALIQKRLTEAVAAGRLTNTQFDLFQKQLDIIAQQEAEFRAKNVQLTLWQFAKLQFELDDLIKKIELSLSDRQLGPVDVAARKQEITRRLDIAFKARRLTEKEKQTFEQQIEATSDLEKEFKKTDGANLTLVSSFKIVLELDRISTELTKTVRSRQIDMTLVQSEAAAADADLKDSIASGKLTDAKVKELTKSLSYINSQAKKYWDSKRFLSEEEQLALLLELQKVSTSLPSRKNQMETLPGVLARLEQAINNCKNKIGQALDSGSLGRIEGKQFYDEIEATDTKRKALLSPLSKETLTLATARNLLVDVEKTASGLDRALTDTSTDWKGIAKSLDDLEQKIEAAASTNRIKDGEAHDLRDQLNKLKSTRNDGMKPGGQLSGQGALKLMEGLTALESQLEKSIPDKPSLASGELETHFDDVKKRLEDAKQQGKLKSDRADALLKELATIDQADSSLAPDRAKLVQAINLEKFDNQLKQELSLSSVSETSIRTLFRQVDEKLRQAILTGHLAPKNISSFKADLERIRKEGTTIQSAQGEPDKIKLAAVGQDLLHLQGHIDEVTRTDEGALPPIDKKQADVYQRITEALLQGYLSSADADSLRREFYKIIDQEAKYKASGAMSFGEHATIILQLEKLVGSLENYMTAGPQPTADPGERRDELDKNIANALITGRISAETARSLASRLDAVNKKEIEYTFSGSGLSHAESLALVADLEKVESAFRVAQAGVTITHKDFEERLDSIQSDIKKGNYTVGFDPEKITSDLERLAETYKRFASAGNGGLTLAEAESINRDLIRIQDRIESHRKSVAVEPTKSGKRK